MPQYHRRAPQDPALQYSNTPILQYSNTPDSQDTVIYTPRDEYEVTVCRSLFWLTISHLASGAGTPQNGKGSGLAPCKPAKLRRDSLPLVELRKKRDIIAQGRT
jgi:hypothetical protein